jgi:murein DD-endopeptidase MepM/ murein hydrolase activator NlpD
MSTSNIKTATTCAIVFLTIPLFLAPEGVRGDAQDPPILTGKGVCTPTSLAQVPAADFLPPAVEPLSPWKITQVFNASMTDEHYIDEDGKHWLGHNGVDLGGAAYDIRSVFSGVVVATSADTGWGNSIVIASRVSLHSREIITTHYHHLSKRYVEVSKDTETCPTVSESMLLGKKGGTGAELDTYAPHLHFTVRYWANLGQLDEWLSQGANGHQVFGNAYPGHNNSKLRGKFSPSDGFDPNSPYTHYGHLSPAHLIKNYFADFLGNAPPHAWAEEYAKKMRHYGIELGEWNGQFGTTMNVKRREAARWLKIALGDKFTGTKPGGQLFMDVPLGDPDLPYIHELTTYPKAPSRSVIDPDGSFSPNTELQRNEALKMVILTFYPAAFNSFYSTWVKKLKNSPSSLRFYLAGEWVGHDLLFNDVPFDEWFAPYVYFGAASKYGKGYIYNIVALDSQHTEFNPANKVARAEMAKWLVLGYEKLHGGGVKDPCANVSCGAGEFCDPNHAVCVVAEKCTPSEGNPCPVGGGGGDCSNGLCEPGENCSDCPQDCGSCDTCGDGQCSGMEDCETCSSDCGDCPAGCPDGLCDGAETCKTCSQDCGFCAPVCSDGICDGAESCDSCPQDCGTCPVACSDGECSADESCQTCPQDCGVCPPVCSDGQCNGAESCESCPQDCGVCPCTDTFDVTQYKCQNFSSANGVGPGGGEILRVCASTDSQTGFMTVRARKFDGTVFGERPYQVRVSEVQGDPCGPDTHYFVISDGGPPEGIGSTELTFTFQSIWEPGQSDKGYCVTASTVPADPGYNDVIEQTSWYYSDKAMVTRECI